MIHHEFFNEWMMMEEVYDSSSDNDATTGRFEDEEQVERILIGGSRESTASIPSGGEFIVDWCPSVGGLEGFSIAAA